MTQIREIIESYQRGYKRFIYIFCAFICVCLFMILISAEYSMTLLATSYTINFAICGIIIIATVTVFDALKTIDEEFVGFLRLRYDFEQGIPCNENKFVMLSLLAKTCNAIMEKKGKFSIGTVTEKISILTLVSDFVENKVFYLGFMSATCISFGLFGTFLGLTETITSLGIILETLYVGLEDANADILSTMVQLIGELKLPLQGMALAFGTSLIGLIGSIIIGIELVILNKSISAAIGDLDEWFTQNIDDAYRESVENSVSQEKQMMNMFAELTNAVRHAGEEQKELLSRLIALEEAKKK